MTAQEFFNKYDSKALNPDGAYGNQCVDVADQYATEVVGSPLPPVNGAKDFWNKNLIGYTKIPNTPDNIPQLGDIIIFGNGQFGHVSIFKEGDVNRFTSFDQNFPTQGYYDTQGNFIGTGVCHFQEHNYDDVLGWFRPQLGISSHADTSSQDSPAIDFIYQGKLDVSNPVKQDHFAQFMGFLNWQAYQDSLNKPVADLQTDLNNAKKDISTLENQLDISNQELAGYRVANKQQADMLDMLNRKVISLETQIKNFADVGNIDTSNPFVRWVLSLLPKKV